MEDNKRPDRDDLPGDLEIFRFILRDLDEKIDKLEGRIIAPENRENGRVIRENRRKDITYTVVMVIILILLIVFLMTLGLFVLGVL